MGGGHCGMCQLGIVPVSFFPRLQPGGEHYCVGQHWGPIPLTLIIQWRLEQV